jgi:hypothetical protein
MQSVTAGRRIPRRTFVGVSTGAAIVPRLWKAVGQRRPEVPSLLDHFILGCSDLNRGVAFVEQRTGIHAVFGGVHPGRGTQNALLSLGERRYLEIMAPDPAQNIEPQIAKLRELNEPRIVGWAAHRDDLERFAAQLREAQIEIEGPREGSRKRLDGKELHWKTLTLKDDHAGMLPFFIEWSKDSIHPSIDSPKGCTLQRFFAVTPEQEDLLDAASRVQLDLDVAEISDKPTLKATLVGPKGAFSVSS